MALFSMNILHDERVVVVAEQKPNCTDEEVSVLLSVGVCGGCGRNMCAGCGRNMMGVVGVAGT